MALTKVIVSGLGAIPAISGASLTSLTSSQVDSGVTTAKAWINFNGTGTVAIRDSHNVSSITDHSTGDYSINFSNNLANVNYAPVGNNSSQEANGSSLMPSVLAVDSLRVNSRNASGTLLDCSKLHFLVFGD